MEEKNNKNNSKINRRDFFKLAGVGTFASAAALYLSLIHISEPTRRS